VTNLINLIVHHRDFIILKSSRYSRLDVVEYLGADSDEEAAERLQVVRERNSEMSRFQRVRLQSAVDPDAGPMPANGESSESSSSEDSTSED
jgi:hypothetical protein